MEEAPLAGKRVLLRVVADVPIQRKKSGVVVTDDYRLRQLLPTLHYLIDYGARIVLASHLGRPGGLTDRDFSLRPVWLELSRLLRRPIQFAPTIGTDATATIAGSLGSGEILALENLRFYPGEEKNSRTFAATLARYADLYINDAFAVCHHPAASIDAITELLPSYGGLGLERELYTISNLMRHPARPYIAIVGGAKISDKLPAIKRLVRQADRVLVGGGVANTFLAASGHEVGSSLIDEDSLDAARALLRTNASRIILPVDHLKKGTAILDIGPKTIELFRSHLRKAETVFWSGPLGKAEEPHFRIGSERVAEAIIMCGATSIVGGGDTVALLENLDKTRNFSFVSSGGGATLELLGGASLPGLRALER